MFHEIMVKLNKTFVTPLDREDIHNLASKIDDLVDIVHALTERMVLFKIENVTPELKEMAAILEKSTELMVLAIRKLRNARNYPEIQDHCVLIHTLENQGDRAYEKALGPLFEGRMGDSRSY